MNKLTSRGFTLIELLVVISIIGLLSSVVMASLQGARTKAQYSRISQDFITLRTAVALYKNSYESMPADLNALVTGGFISRIPTSPVSGAPYFYSTAVYKYWSTNYYYLYCGQASMNDEALIYTSLPSSPPGLSQFGVTGSPISGVWCLSI